MKKLCSLWYLSLCAIDVWCAEKPIVIVVPSYNNIKFYEKNLDSIRKQEYTNYHVLYIDDCSADGTGQAVEEYIKKWHLEEKISLFKNATRRGAMYNHYSAAHACPDHVIIATLDGDDWLPDDNPHVLSRINEAYQKALMTYGQFQEYPSGKKGFCKEMPFCVKQLNKYRDYAWLTSHMRTYYAGLFKQIPIGYFIRNGSFLQTTCDLAIMFAVLELSGGRAEFIDDIIYTYNMTNGTSDCYIKFFEQLNNDHWVRSRMPLTAASSYESEQCETSMLYTIHLSTDYARGATFCATLAVAQVNFVYAHVFYHAENEGRYPTLCEPYGISSTAVGDNTDFKTVLCTYLETLPAHSYVLLSMDGCEWRDTLQADSVMSMLGQTKSLCYSCTRGTDQHRDLIMADDERTQPAFVQVKQDFYVWKPNESRGDAHHPYMGGALIMRTDLLCERIKHLRGMTIEQFCTAFAQLSVDNEDDTVLCTAYAPCQFIADSVSLDQYHHNKNQVALLYEHRGDFVHQ